MYSAPNSSQLLVGAIPYGAEYLHAARKYGVDPYSGSMPSFNPTVSASAMAALHRSKQKAKARQQAPAIQPQAQPRQEEEHDIGDGLEENCFALVSTEELEKQGLRPHPDKIAEAAALSSVSLPVGSYKMCLPAQLIQGKLQSFGAVMPVPLVHCSHTAINSNGVFHYRPHQCSAVPGCQAGLPKA